MAGPGDGAGFGVLDDAAFGCGVCGGVCGAEDGHHGADVDVFSGAFVSHVVEGEGGDVVHRGEVGVDDVSPVFVGEVLGFVGASVRAGVVDDDVPPAEG